MTEVMGHISPSSHPASGQLCYNYKSEVRRMHKEQAHVQPANNRGTRSILLIYSRSKCYLYYPHHRLSAHYPYCDSPHAAQFPDVYCAPGMLLCLALVDDTSGGEESE